MSIIKKLLLLLALSLAASGAQVYAADQKKQLPEIGQIIAVVNDDVITQHELDERVNTAVRRLKKRGTPLPDHAALEGQLLENVILELLLAQSAKENGVRVDDDQLDRALHRIAEDNHFSSLEQYRASLEKDGEDFRKFREEIRAQMVAARLRERLVDSRLLISDSEVDNYLAVESGQPGKGEEFHVAHILVTIPEQASAEKVQASQKRANEALALLNKGASFAQVAAGHSDAQDALQGGDLGWRPSDQFPPSFREVLAKMQAGDISPLIHAPNAYHILKLVDRRRQTEKVIITQTHVRHILVKTSDLVPDSEARSRIMEIKKSIENGASFAEQAKLHSEDGSAAQGGDLGWASPGEMVPEFEKAMNALQPGEMSGPVQTSFGWHLIQVLERRNADVSEEQRRQRARMALRSIKSDDAWQDWLRQLRDSAHIEYRGETAH
ncbi:MAG TPA: peptidylprolyl isomerase [Gallionellaceae bacterium]